MENKEQKYPFVEGDDYWTIEKKDDIVTVVWSCWDDISEEMHDEKPDVYYKTMSDAVKEAKKLDYKTLHVFDACQFDPTIIVK